MYTFADTHICKVASCCVCTGLNAVNWASFLKEAPKHAKNELVKNIREGVVIKLEKPLKRCRHNNLSSVRGRINSDFIDKYINEECEKGRILGPFENIDFWEEENIHIVPLGWFQDGNYV